MKMFHSAFFPTVGNPIFICTDCLSTIMWTGNGHVTLTTEKQFKEHGIEEVIKEYRIKRGR